MYICKKHLISCTMDSCPLFVFQRVFAAPPDASPTVGVAKQIHSQKIISCTRCVTMENISDIFCACNRCASTQNNEFVNILPVCNRCPTQHVEDAGTCTNLSFTRHVSLHLRTFNRDALAACGPPTHAP